MISKFRDAAQGLYEIVSYAFWRSGEAVYDSVEVAAEIIRCAAEAIVIGTFIMAIAINAEAIAAFIR